MQVWLLHGTSQYQGFTHGSRSSSLCCQIFQWYASNAGYCLAWSGASHSRGIKTHRGHTSGMSVQATMLSEVLLVSEIWSTLRDSMQLAGDAGMMFTLQLAVVCKADTRMLSNCIAHLFTSEASTQQWNCVSKLWWCFRSCRLEQQLTLLLHKHNAAWSQTAPHIQLSHCCVGDVSLDLAEPPVWTRSLPRLRDCCCQVRSYHRTHEPRLDAYVWSQQGEGQKKPQSR